MRINLSSTLLFRIRTIGQGRRDGRMGGLRAPTWRAVARRDSARSSVSGHISFGCDRSKCRLAAGADLGFSWRALDMLGRDADGSVGRHISAHTDVRTALSPGEGLTALLLVRLQFARVHTMLDTARAKRQICAGGVCVCV